MRAKFRKIGRIFVSVGREEQIRLGFVGLDCLDTRRPSAGATLRHHLDPERTQNFQRTVDRTAVYGDKSVEAATRPGLGYDGSMTSRHFRSLRTSMHIKASTPCLLIVELAQRRRDNRSFTRIRSAGRALEKLSLMTWPVDLVTSTVGIS